jgi:hypothetical protein
MWRWFRRAAAFAAWCVPGNTQAEKQDHEKRLRDMYQDLSPPMRSRYEFVADVAKAIRSNYARLSATSQMFTQQMEEKLNGLLSGYIRLLFSSKVHQEYVLLLRPEQVRDDIAKLEKGMAGEPVKVQEINKRRIEILQKRLEKFDKIKENRGVIDAQVSAIEEVLQLIRDQSVTMRDPQEGQRAARQPGAGRRANRAKRERNGSDLCAGFARRWRRPDASNGAGSSAGADAHAHPELA